MSTLDQINALMEANRRGLDTGFSPKQIEAWGELKRRKGNKLDAFVEPALTAATGMGASAVSGFLGLTALPFGVDKSVGVINRVQDALTYKPKTEAGNKGLQSMGSGMQTIGDYINQKLGQAAASPMGLVASTAMGKTTLGADIEEKGVGQALGDRTLEATDSPALATLASLTPDIAEAMVGMSGAKALTKGMKQYEFGDIYTQAHGQKGLFAGIRAKGADLDAQKKAEQMAESGASRDEIWNETGWFKGADDQWRFEIDDSQASLTEKGSDTVVYSDQGSVVSHKALGEQYPDTMDIDIAGGLGDREGGAYTPPRAGTDTDMPIYEQIDFEAPDLEKRLDTLLHENQHAIQRREGFATGGSPRGFIQDAKAESDLIMNNVRQLNDDMSWLSKNMDKVKASDMSPDVKSRALNTLKEKYNDLMSQRGDLTKKIINDPVEYGFGQYKRLLGEAEARLVEARKTMTPEERRAYPPMKHLDDMLKKEGIAGGLNELIVRRDGGVAKSTKGQQK